MRMGNVQAVIQALNAYGEAARGDYYGLDGKTIQRDMWEITDALESGLPSSADELISRLGITKTDDGYEWM